MQEVSHCGHGLKLVLSFKGKSQPFFINHQKTIIVKRRLFLNDETVESFDVIAEGRMADFDGLCSGLVLGDNQKRVDLQEVLIF